MSGDMTTARPTAAHVAVAIVAACEIRGLDPARAFEDGGGHQKARVIAAAGCCARLGWSKAEAGRLFRIEPQRLAPSMMDKAGVTLEHMLTIAEALASAGLTGGAKGVFEAAAGANPPAHKPARSAGRASNPTGAAPAARAAAVAEKPNPRRHQPPKAARVARNEKAEARPRGAVAPPSSASVAPGVRRLRHVTERILRFARWFVAADWDIEDVAELFDVRDDALADALEFGVTA